MAENDRFFEMLAIQVAGGSTVRDAAAHVGCSESTAYRASGSQGFRLRVAELRTEATQAAVGRLSESASLAVETLTDLLADDNDPGVRLQAAKAVLANVIAMGDHYDLRQRLDAIEGRERLKVAS